MGLRFSGLKNGQYEITSPQTPSYNCVAWAAGDDTRPWWPVPYPSDPPYYWPERAKDELLEDFISGFETLGYSVCKTGEFELGYEKVAIYVRDGEVSHMARQQTSGLWTSKCGGLYDLEHESLAALEGLQGREYGYVECFMRRKLPTIVDEDYGLTEKATAEQE